MALHKPRMSSLVARFLSVAVWCALVQNTHAASPTSAHAEMWRGLGNDPQEASQGNQAVSAFRADGRLARTESRSA